MDLTEFATSAAVTAGSAAVILTLLFLVFAIWRPLLPEEVDRARGLLAIATDVKASRGHHRCVLIAAYAIEVNNAEGMRRYLTDDLMERLRMFAENAIDETEFDREACSQMKGKLHEIIADIAFEKGDATRLDLLCSVGKEAEVWIEVRDSLEKVRVALREALNKCFTPLDEVFKRAIEAKSVSGQMEAPTPTDAKTKKASTPTEAAMKKAAKAAHKALKAIGTEVNEIRAKFVVPLVPKVDRAVENAQLRHQRTLVRFWLWV